jgi:ABC-type amino acid transport system permease subunit
MNKQSPTVGSTNSFSSLFYRETRLCRVAVKVDSRKHIRACSPCIELYTDPRYPGGTLCATSLWLFSTGWVSGFIFLTVAFLCRRLRWLKEFLQLYRQPFRSTPSHKRQDYVDRFNEPSCQKCKDPTKRQGRKHYRRLWRGNDLSTYSNLVVFLLSAKSGGVGLNLIGASRLVRSVAPLVRRYEWKTMLMLIFSTVSGFFLLKYLIETDHVWHWLVRTSLEVIDVWICNTCVLMISTS